MKPARKKRLKLVYNSMQSLVEIFAKQSQPEGRISEKSSSWGRSHGKISQGYFEGRRLYSYGSHYLLAAFTEFKGKPVAIVNYKKYSNTTSGHSRTAARVLEDCALVIEIRDFELNRSTTDAELTEVIIKQLGKKSMTLAEQVKALPETLAQPKGYYSHALNRLVCLKEEIETHNALLHKLGLDTLKVGLPGYNKLYSVAAFADEANELHRTRKQLFLFDQPNFRYYESRALNKKVS